MGANEWKYYNHAIIPNVAPNKDVDLNFVNGKEIWKINKKALLIRYTTNFDCDRETNWWYVIKDTPFCLSSLKSKRRYDINKGIKNFEVKEINPCDYKEEIYSVQVEAYSAYPEKYRPTIEKEKFTTEIESWAGVFIVLGAFYRETGELAGYSLLEQIGDYVDFKVQKTKPSFEKFMINAALVEGVLRYFDTFLLQGGFICDGARNVNHETAFQDYLEKLFGFRKAYCRLHIVYNPKIKWIIKLIYPFRRILGKMDGVGFVHNLNSVLKMEEIVREQKKIWKD